MGTSVLLASLRHPLHIAEEAAVVDILSNGRLELGMGAGYVPDDFEAFGVERADKFKRLDHAIGEVRRLLDEVVMPRPVQERIPIWCGYFGKGARRAGLLGEGLMSMVPSALEPYVEGLIAGGHDPASARMAGLFDVIVSDDPERTRALLQPHIDYQANAYGKFFHRVDIAEGRPLTPPDKQYGAAQAANYQVLTPDAAIVHIRERSEGLPVQYATPWLWVGGMPEDLAGARHAHRHQGRTGTRIALTRSTGGLLP